MQAFARDDMVLRPRVRGRMSKVREHAQLERGVEQTAKKGHKIGRLLRMRAKQKAVGIGRRLVGRTMNAAFTDSAKIGIRSAIRGSATSGARAAFGGPVAAGVAVAVVAALVIARLTTGRSFENMAENLKQSILGDNSPEAVAWRRARDEVAGNDDFAWMIGGGSDSAAAQAAKITSAMAGIYKVEEVGRDAIRADKEFQVNGTFDILILRVADAVKQAWNGSGGPELVDELVHRLGSAIVGYQLQFLMQWMK